MRWQQPLRVELSTDAKDDLRRLDWKLRERILRAIRRFAETGYGDIDRIEGEENLYRQRVGKWRVFFEYQEEGTVVHVLYIRARGSAYKP